MAAEVLNKAGGFLGKKIEIIEEDHGSKNTEGANVTQKLITRDKVVAIVGDPTTAITKIAAPIAQEKKVVLLSAGAVGTGVVENGDYIFVIHYWMPRRLLLLRIMQKIILYGKKLVPTLTIIILNTRGLNL